MTFSTYSAGDPGLGDRMRTILWGLRAAASINALFFISMTHPIPLEEVFQPNYIDWRPPGNVWGTQMPANLGGTVDIHRLDKHIVFGGGAFPHAHDPLPWTFPGSDVFDVDPSIESEDLHCLFSFLFKENPSLTTAVDKAHNQLFNGSDFVAAHVRSGGFHGEEDTLGFGDVTSSLLGALYCLKQWKLPILLVSGNRLIRKATLQNYLTNEVKALDVHVVHTKAHVTAADHMSTFVEIGMMARATCFVRTRSGFSDIARWLGGNTKCIRYVGTGDRAPVGNVTTKECADEFKESR